MEALSATLEGFVVKVLDAMGISARDPIWTFAVNTLEHYLKTGCTCLEADRAELRLIVKTDDQNRLSEGDIARIDNLCKSSMALSAAFSAMSATFSAMRTQTKRKLRYNNQVMSNISNVSRYTADFVLHHQAESARLKM